MRYQPEGIILCKHSVCEKKTIEFTDHAIRRCQQRGIKKQFASLAAIYGKKSRAGQGMFMMFFNRSCFQKAIRSGGKLRRGELEAAIGVRVIVRVRKDSSLIVVTVLPKLS